MKTYPALVLAGYSTETPDPLAIAMGVERKSLIPIAGQPMVAWVVNALKNSPFVDQIYIVGMAPEDHIDFGTEIHYIPNQNKHFDNVMAGLDAIKAQRPDVDRAIIASADIPALQTETVNWFVETCTQTDKDIYYSIIEKSIMESAYPDSRRSYVPLKEGKFCGGDLFFLRVAVAHNNEDLVRELLARRKNAFQAVRLLGLKVIIKFLFRRLSIQDVEGLTVRLVNARGVAVPSPYADLGMDVDKPHQLELVRAQLEARVKKEAGE